MDTCEDEHRRKPSVDDFAESNSIITLIIYQNNQSKQIRSVPTVVLISGKNVVDGFTGLPSEEQLNTFFGLIDKLTGTKEEEARVNVKLFTFMTSKREYRRSSRVVSR